MSVGLRCFLIFGSILTLMYVVRNIRKVSIRIEDTIFWILICGVLLVISIFPEIAFFCSDLLGIQSPINFVFLLIIFILFINQFYMSLKISRLLIKQKEIVQYIALEKKEEEEKEEK